MKDAPSKDSPTTRSGCDRLALPKTQLGIAALWIFVGESEAYLAVNGDVTPRQLCAGLNSTLLDSGDPVMTTSAKLSGVVLFSGLAFASGSAGVSAEEAASCHVAPFKGSL